MYQLKASCNFHHSAGHQTRSHVIVLRNQFNTFSVGARLKKSPFMKSMQSSTP